MKYNDGSVRSDIQPVVAGIKFIFFSATESLIFMAASYTLEIRHPHQHLIDVTLQLDAPDPQGQVLRLPNWIPGSYMIRDFSRNIVTLTATSCLLYTSDAADE